MKWMCAGRRLFIRVATIVAGLIVVVVLVGYFSNAAAGEPVIPIAALLLAGAIWLDRMGVPPRNRRTLKFVRQNQTETLSSSRTSVCPLSAPRHFDRACECRLSGVKRT